MKESIDPSEHDQPLDDSQPTDIEVQLRSFRPRTPELNWDQITAQGIDRPTVHLAPALTRSGFTAKQMTLAVAASWMLGALVGGGGILWSMSSSEVAGRSIEPAVKETAAPSQPPIIDTECRDHPETDFPQPVVAEPSLAALDFNVTAWQLDGPLGVRSLPPVNSATRFTTVRSAGTKTRGRNLLQTSSTTTPPEDSSRSLDHASSQVSSGQPLTTTPMSNRQQLLQQYLKETDSQVY